MSQFVCHSASSHYEEAKYFQISETQTLGMCSLDHTKSAGVPLIINSICSLGYQAANGAGASPNNLIELLIEYRGISWR